MYMSHVNMHYTQINLMGQSCKHRTLLKEPIRSALYNMCSQTNIAKHGMFLFQELFTVYKIDPNSIFFYLQKEKIEVYTIYSVNAMCN